MFESLIDFSNISIGIGICSFFIIFFVTRYYLIKENKTEMEYNGYSFLSAIILSVIVVVLYKQFLLLKGSKVFLDDNFK